MLPSAVFGHNKIAMKKVFVILSLTAVLGFALEGCSGGDSGDNPYKTPPPTGKDAKAKQDNGAKAAIPEH